MVSLTPGTLALDRYRVVRPLPPWRGSAVLARDERLSQEVDLVVAPAPAGTPLGALFAWRAGIIGALQHPALPVVCDVALHDGYPLLVCRHVDGLPLSHILDGGRHDLTTLNALRLVADVAQALGLAHAQGLCHGAFSAQSVLLDAQGNAVIGDLAWPYGARNAAAATSFADVATPYVDVVALGRLLARLLEATPGAESVAVRRDAAVLLHRLLSPRLNARFVTGAEVSQAIVQLTALHDAGPDTRAAGVRPARPVTSMPPRPVNSMPARQAPATARAARQSGVVLQSRPLPRAAGRRPAPPRAGGAYPWAVALVAAAAIALLPSVEIVTHYLLSPASLRPWSAYNQGNQFRAPEDPWWHRGEFGPDQSQWRLKWNNPPDERPRVQVGPP